MVTPESTGLDIAIRIIISFIDILVSQVGRVIVDDVIGGFFDVFVGYIFGGGLSVELAFLLVLSLVILGVYYKYIHAVVG